MHNRVLNLMLPYIAAENMIVLIEILHLVTLIERLFTKLFFFQDAVAVFWEKVNLCFPKYFLTVQNEHLCVGFACS